MMNNSFSWFTMFLGTCCGRRVGRVVWVTRTSYLDRSSSTVDSSSFAARWLPGPWGRCSEALCLAKAVGLS